MDISRNEGGRVLLVAFVLSGCMTEPPRPGPRELLERSLEAMAIPAEPGSDEGLVLEARGELNQGVENQGRSPGSFDRSDFRETLAVDVVSERLAYEYRHDRIDGSQEWIRDLYEHDTRTIAVRTDGFAVGLKSPDLVAERRSLWRRFPHLLLREALGPSSRISGDGSNRVALELASGETLVLVLDEASGLLERVEYLTDLQSFGDTEVVWSFADYETLDGFGLVPHSYRVSVSDRPFIEMHVARVSADPEDWSELLTLPDGMNEPELRTLPRGADASARARVETVAAGVHVVRNLRLGFHPMFIELSDGVVVIDAPAGYRLLTQLPAGDVAPGASSAWLSERYLELIEETVPDKPVEYVVLTHFHNDHAGGLRAFVARGATVVGPASIREAIENLVSAPHTVAPDALASSPRELRFEAVEGSRTLGAIELIEVGPNPHDDAMLVVHIPKERILFTSDMIGLDPFFMGWLTTNRLAPERIFSMHGAEPSTPKELERH